MAGKMTVGANSDSYMSGKRIINKTSHRLTVEFFTCTGTVIIDVAPAFCEVQDKNTLCFCSRILGHSGQHEAYFGHNPEESLVATWWSKP